MLLGPGELYMDCALHDLRTIYADGIAIKVVDPVAKFGETVTESSYLRCHATTPNGLNRITMISEPLDKRVLQALSAGQLPDPVLGSRELFTTLKDEFGWDILAARSVWAFDRIHRRARVCC